METQSQQSFEKTALADAQNDRTMAILAHAGGIFFGFIPALIIWLSNKNDPGALYVSNQAKEALNFQITIGIAFFICLLLVFVLIGALLIWVVWIVDIVYCILGAVKSSKGENFRYPFTFRIIT